MLPPPAIAQAWSNKPIKIICTYRPGGLTDVFSRAYGEFVSAKLGQPVVVENKTGAAGVIGAEMVKHSSPADGGQQGRSGKEHCGIPCLGQGS